MLHSIDQRFVGTWKGSDQGQLTVGEVNHWIIKRTSDGLYFISFETHYDDGEIIRSEGEGIWFVENGYYYASRELEDELDCYQFVFLASNAIQFIDIEERNNKVYQFVDYKVIVN